MNRVFEKIIEELNKEKWRYFLTIANTGDEKLDYTYEQVGNALDKAVEIVKQEADQYNNGWISCSEKKPPVETEVFIVTKRKYRSGKVKYTTTTAIYEDGTVSETNSNWLWEDIEGEWDKENKCYLIPEGWWETDFTSNVLNNDNNAIDDEVVAWQPLPGPYRPNEE